MIVFWLFVALLAIVAISFSSKPNHRPQSTVQSPQKPWVIEPVYRYVKSKNGVNVEVDWEATLLVIEQALLQEDYDFARTWMQKFSYASAKENMSQSMRDDFQQLMRTFVNLDPLYSALISKIVSLVYTQSGIMQTAIYSQIPSYSEEQIRYTLYLLHELGDITRVKKGRSYQLFLPSQTQRYP